MGSEMCIRDRGSADPTAAILSAAMLLRHLGDEENAARVEEAVAEDVSSRGDAPVRTTEIGDRIASALAS